MGRITLAFKLFFRILGNGDFANEAEKLADTGRAALPGPLPAAAPAPRPPARSEALSLLAVLQREGRLIDFLKEDLSTYADAQIGAAVRDVHRDTAAALERLFALRPLRAEAEGASIDIPSSFDATQIKLTGNVSGHPPYHGALRHAGWRATKVELPEWTGSDSSARVVAPAEVEV